MSTNDNNHSTLDPLANPEDSLSSQAKGAAVDVKEDIVLESTESQRRSSLKLHNLHQTQQTESPLAHNHYHHDSDMDYHTIRTKSVELDENGLIAHENALEPWRTWVFDKVVSHPLFDKFILLVILGNCITLAISNPSLDPDSSQAQTLNVVEYVFTAIFTCEMVIKWVAMGLRGYFDDPWNKLDFIIVVSSYLTELPGVSNFSAIRILRILRPLRTVNKLKGLRIIIQTLLTSLPALGNVFILMMFLFVIYAIIGIQLWKGTLRQQCFKGSELVNPPGEFCSYSSSSGHQCDASLGQECLPLGNNPFSGIIGFDNIGMGMLTIFASVTLADWAKIMYAYMDASSGYSWIYFASLILFVSFFAVNLVLAVVSDTFSDATQTDDEENPEVTEQLVDSSSDDDDEEAKEWQTTSGDGGNLTNIVVDAPTHGDSATAIELVTIHSVDSKDNVETIEEEPEDESDAEGPTITRRRSIIDSLTASASTEAVRRVSAATRKAVRKATDPAVQEKQEQFLEIMLRATFKKTTEKTTVERPNLDFKSLVRAVAPIYNAACSDLEVKSVYLKDKPKFVHKVFWFVERPMFNAFIILVIVVNTIFLALEHEGMSQTFKDNLEIGNTLFTFIFVAEMVLKLIAYGVYGYSRDAWNLFDGFIVVISMVEFVALSGGALSVLRTFRLLRILKLAKSVKSLRILLGTVAASVSSVAYMTLLLFLFLFMFAVLGMQLFSGRFDNIEDGPISRYDDIYWSIITVFQVLTGDGWVELMGLSVRATSNLAILFYLVVVILGAFIVINLFIAILLENFSNEDNTKFMLEDLEDRADMLARSDVRTDQALQILARKLGEMRVLEYDEKVAKQNAVNQNKRLKMQGKSLRYFGPDHPVRQFCWGLMHYPLFEWFIIVAIILNCVFLAMENPGVDDDSSLGQLLAVADIVFMAIFTVEMFIKWVALGVFIDVDGQPSQAYFRDSWNQLDAFVVLVSVITLAAPSFGVARAFRALRPVRVIVRSDQIKVVVSSLYQALPAITNVFLFCALFWLIFGILGVSLFKGRFRECTDTAVLSEASCVGFYNATTSSGTVTLPRQWQNYPVHFDNTYEAIVALFQVATLSGWMDITYKAVGVRTSDGGRKVHYDEPAAALFFVAFVIVCSFFTLNLFIGVVIDNFNRLKKEYDGSAFLTAEQRQWVATQRIIKSVELNASPERPQHWLRGFCYDLVTPKSMHKKPDTEAMRPPEGSGDSDNGTTNGPGDDHKWNSNPGAMVINRTDTITSSAGVSSEEPQEYEHHRFEEFIMAMILLNMLVMTFEHYDQPDGLTDFLFVANLIFIIIFTLEAILKITAFGFVVYWSDDWSKFDFIIVIASLFGLAFNAGVGANVVRVFRIGRIFRLVKRAEALKNMFNTLILSLPSLWNIGSLLFVIFFIFAVLGVNFFGRVLETEDGLDRHTNFKDFGNAMLTLFRMATGDQWETVLYGTTITEDNSDCSEAAGTCGSRLAPLYFILFMVMGSMVMVNLYIAVILENFSQDTGDDIDPRILTKVKGWSAAWSKFDPKARKKLAVNKFEDMMAAAPLPFGFGRKIDQLRTLRRLQDVRIPIFFESYKPGSRVKYPKPAGRPQGVWKVRFDVALERLSQTIATVQAEEEEETGIEGEWTFDLNCFKGFYADHQYTLDEWYAVQILEQNWLQRREGILDRSVSVSSSDEPFEDSPDEFAVSDPSESGHES